MTWAAIDSIRNIWFRELSGSPFLEGYLPTDTRFPYGAFLDSDYDGSDFLDGEYNLTNVPDVDLISDMMQLVDRNVTQNALGLTRNFNTSIPFDYNGTEDYYAAYVNPIFKIGENLTVIPGFRYEKNITEYTGIRTTPVGRWQDPFPYDTATVKRENDYFLPMIHVRYDIAEGLDVRASYTKTLSRPSYNLIVPSWQMQTGGGLSWNNPNLEPIESENLDLMLSLYGNKVGLLTLGIFHKTISNFI